MAGFGIFICSIGGILCFMGSLILIKYYPDLEHEKFMSYSEGKIAAYKDLTEEHNKRTEELKQQPR